MSRSISHHLSLRQLPWKWKKKTSHSYTSFPDNESPTEPSLSSKFNLSVCLLLELMDIDDPSPTFKYVECENELQKLGIRGILDVHCIPRMILTTFSDLKWYRANHFHTCQKAALTRRTSRGCSRGGVELGLSGKQLCPATPELTAWWERLADKLTVKC